MSFYEYHDHYFKLKSLRDYQYLSKSDYNKFQWNIVRNLYNYLQSQGKLDMYNELTNLSIKQQNIIIIKSIILPKPYKCIYNEKH